MVEESDPQKAFFLRVGTLTRTLHDALRELGYHKNVEQAVQALPDARARLDYIANLTGNAAERALAAAERGKAMQDEVHATASELAKRWEAVASGQASLREFEGTAGATRAFLTGLPDRAARTNEQFLEVMMAQDFHDLTGQVIHRVVALAQDLEEQLVKLLIEATPPEQRVDPDKGKLSGPVVDAKGREDVVTSQAQVDDLLESLGF